MQDIRKAFSKECRSVSLTAGNSTTGYTLEAIETKAWHADQYTLTVLDAEGDTFSRAKYSLLRFSVKDTCHAIKTFKMIEVVDTENLTQSSDYRNDTSGGVIRASVNRVAGRRTHTDNASIYVVVNGERALLDCYEHRTGCTTIGPGKYYGELKGNSIWMSYRMPITHEQVRNHYKIAGSW